MTTVSEQELIYSDFGADADLSDLVEMFVSEVPDRLHSMFQAAEISNWEQLGRDAHQMKGAAGSYGFGSITAAAAILERECRKNSNEGDIRRRLAELVNMCSRMRAGTRE